MLTPQQTLRITIEIIFVLLGGLVIWLGLTGHIFFDRRKPGWLLLGGAVIVWGLRALYKRAPGLPRRERWARGLSLTLLGFLMLAISRVPFLWVGPLLAVAGAVLILRGLAGAVLILQPHS